jgi:RNA ligase (TIGR02306 family)
MERKLASIKTITNIQPIEGADMIELASVGGWNVIVAKNVGHKVGDWVVYCEIDSFLPIREEFEFLRKSSYKKMGDREGFRLRTMKMRGQISQGLILPFSILPLGDTFHEGQDVTEILGIVKWEPPIPAELAGKIKGYFPNFLVKTDEERIQNLESELYYIVKSGKRFYSTEKLDGSSSTFYVKDNQFGVCSRNLELLETEENTFWRVARYLDLETKMKSLGKNISLQGELIGEGIQGNPYKIKGQTVKFFNAFDIDSNQYFDLESFKEIINLLNLETVPILDEDFIIPNSISKLLEMAEEKSVLNENFDREGIVIRSHDRTISFKVISNKFLLKNDG